MHYFDVHNHGEPTLKGIRDSDRGVLFLGAHLGSFEIMRALAEVHSVPINILGYFGNAKMITKALRQLDSRWDGNLIEITPGRVDFVLEIRTGIDRGEHVMHLETTELAAEETAERIAEWVDQTTSVQEHNMCLIR